VHKYTVTTDEHDKVFFFLVVTSILAAWGLGWVYTKLAWSPPWWLDAPAPFGIYVLLNKLFEEQGWRWRLLHRLGYISTPILAGTWKVTLTSSYDAHATPHEGTAIIRQTWRSISVALTMPRLTSASVSASVRFGAHGVLFSYDYENHPFANSPSTMHTHEGTVRLTYDPEAQVMRGHYFSGRDRATHGTIEFVRLDGVAVASGAGDQQVS
jgi:hypothetical protein